MEIRTMRIEDLSPADYNPRVDLQPGDPDYEALRRSVEEFGLVEPLVFNERTGRLVGGHQRLKVIRAAGWTEVEVSVVDLNEAGERALNVGLNKISGHWDNAALEELVREISTEDLPLTGFSTEEINRLFGLRSDGKPRNSDPKPSVSSSGPSGEPVKPVTEEEPGERPPEEFPVLEVGEESFEHDCPRCGFRW